MTAHYANSGISEKGEVIVASANVTKTTYVGTVSVNGVAHEVVHVTRYRDGGTTIYQTADGTAVFPARLGNPDAKPKWTSSNEEPAKESVRFSDEELSIISDLIVARLSEGFSVPHSDSILNKIDAR